METDYYIIVGENLKNQYSTMLYILEINFIANLKYFFGRSYGIMSQIVEYVKSFENKFNNLNGTQLNLTYGFDCKYEYTKYSFV